MPAGRRDSDKRRYGEGARRGNKCGVEEGSFADSRSIANIEDIKNQLPVGIIAITSSIAKNSNISIKPLQEKNNSRDGVERKKTG